MRLDRGWIENHVPHQGSMCLLDEVLDWDAVQITCRSATHRALDNPLRAHGQLGVACGIEYAAQAMALHGALMAAESDAPPRVGFLASVRGIALHVSRLDDVQADLVAKAERITGDQRTVLYEFSVSGGDQLLLRGRASIVLADPADRSRT